MEGESLTLIVLTKVRNELKRPKMIKNDLKPLQQRQEKISRENKNGKKSKSEFLPSYTEFTVFADTAYFCSLNHILQLKAFDRL